VFLGTGGLIRGLGQNSGGVERDAAQERKGMAQTPTVLIVDDDPAIRNMLVEVLSLEGYTTETAKNGREALDKLATSGPRVVLLDLLMPEVDGWGVMHELNANPAERAKHKIILVSALPRLEQSKDLQADGMLAKPFRVDQLMEVLAPMAAV
jgi:CheY-like chemotaxis protein